MGRLAHRAADRSRQAGQAAVELVGYVFVVVLVALLCVQAVFAVQAAGAAQEAARNGARALSLGRADWPQVVADTLPDWARAQTILGESHDGTARVRVAVRVPIGVRSVTHARLTFDRTAEMPVEDSWP